MRASVINQYLTRDSTAARLDRLLREFSAQQHAQFRGLVAFASAAGLRLIEPALRHFLFDLKRAYPGRVDARVFSTGDNQYVFHPKVYWLDGNERKVVVVGSAN